MEKAIARKLRKYMLRGLESFNDAEKDIFFKMIKAQLDTINTKRLAAQMAYTHHGLKRST